MQSWMIGTVSAIVFAGSWRELPPWPLSLLLTAFALGAWRWRSPFARLLCGLACGSALGLIYGTALLQDRVQDSCVGLPLIATGRVSSLPIERRSQHSGRQQRFQFTIDELAPAKCSGPEKVLLSYYGPDRILPGETWQFEVKLRKPWGLSNPGSFNMQSWFAQEGIDAVGSARKSGLAQRITADVSVIGAHHRLRQQISAGIAELGMDRDVMAMLQAMTVADNGAIDQPLWQLGQQLGINHLLVISGSHIAIVAGVGFFLGSFITRLLPGSRLGYLRIPHVCALVLACMYGALAGFSIPVQRALFMLGCFVVASLTGRRSGAAKTLLLAATAVLMCNPLAALSSGFWLSFGAVVALLWMARWQPGVGVFGRVLATHGFMSLVMLPLGALFFGGGSLVAMLANLVMIPLVGIVVVPLSLLAVVVFLFGWPGASSLWSIAGWPLQQLLPPAYALADMGAKWMYVPLNGSLLQILLALFAVALFIVPGGVIQKMLTLVLALPMLLPPVRIAPAPTLATEITVLDVGQGTAVVVRSGDRALVYDTGGGDPGGVNMGSMAVLPFLQHAGVTALDTLVISHPDIDHSAGTVAIREALVVDRFRYGGTDPGSGEGRPCVAGEAWRWPGGQTFQFLSPAQESPRSSNDGSCVLQLQVGNYRLLLPGDIEEERERTLVRYWGEELDSDWLLAAHHGSRTSTALTWLKSVRPAEAVFSSGYANRFGHPHSLVVQRLHEQGVKTYSTASEGALEFKVAPPQTPHISAHRHNTKRYWM